MTQGPSRILDEMAKLMNDGAGLAQGIKTEAENAFRAQADKFMSNMDLVQREDFEVVREMASRLREENDQLQAMVEKLGQRIDALEKTFGEKPSAVKAPRKNSAGK